MTDYEATLEAVRLASQEIADGEWHGDDHAPNRSIRAGQAYGTVSVFTSKHGPGATVSLEVDGLSKEQAIAVLRVLTPGYRVTVQPRRGKRVTYDIPGDPNAS